MKALIIDDEIDICFLLKNILGNKSIQTEYVNSINEAKNALAIDQPEIIFLDNQLPDGKGVDFITYIKNIFPHIKVAMITADESSTIKKNALARGIDYFIEKPFTKEIIYQVVAKFSAPAAGI